MKYKLRKMKLDEISLCPSGDNPPAKVLIAKGSPDMSSLHTPSTCDYNPDKSGKCKTCGKGKKAHALMKAHAVLSKYNKNHDSKGMFASGGGGGAKKKASGGGVLYPKQKINRNSLKPNEEKDLMANTKYGIGITTYLKHRNAGKSHKEALRLAMKHEARAQASYDRKYPHGIYNPD